MTRIPALDDLAEQFSRLSDARGSTVRAGASRWGTALVAAVLIIGAVVGGFVGGSVLGPERVRAGVPLTLHDGKLAIFYDQVLTDREGVEAQLEAAGLQVQVRDVPASPSMVGHVVISPTEGPLVGEDITHPIEPLVVQSCDEVTSCWEWWPPQTPQIDDPHGYTAGVLIPIGYDGFTEIWVGRPASASEAFQLDAPPWAADEILNCQPVLFATVPAARRMLEQTTAHVQWRLEDTLDPTYLEALDFDPYNREIHDIGAAGDDLIVENLGYGLTDDPHGVQITVARADKPELSPSERQAHIEFHGMMNGRFQRSCGTDLLN